jgi:predicted secreted protein
VPLGKHEALFHQLDTNNDQLVNGSDIKGVLMQSGLSNQVLAQIWSLVDMRKSGMLNHEQFELA